MASWISQFQMYAFATAKHWGRGPRAWTARELEPFAYRSSDGEMPEDIKSPPPLCRWTIHIYEQYEYDEDDWPAEWYDVPIQERLRNALEHNDFTNIRPSDLPVALPAIAKTATRQPNELFLESLRLAIMTRNLELVSQLVPELTKGDLATHMTSLLHLAVGYLDGGEACCSILHCLLRRDYPRYHDYINDKGYTLLDSLMATIVKSHTDLRPSILDEFNKESLFPGDEVSTCGRWDVDADCIQQMRLAGQKRVPWSWKHKFCHTSAQAICHSMEAVLKQSVRPYTSGLFRKLCTNCGLKLQLHPLHTLVKVTFLIAEAGCAEEDLFGMTACLLMLLAYYEDAKPKASVSLTLLFDGELDTTMETCMHQKFSPSELACALRKYRRQCWTKKLETGWRLFQLLLTRAEKAADQLDEAWDRYEENGEKGPEPPEGYCHEHEFEGPLTRDETLRTVWAAVQTEFLTYRRINLDDPWISDKFDMEELLQSLQNGRTPSIGLIRDGLRKPLCECGNFDMSRPATAEDVSAKHFSNFSDIHDERCTEI